MSVGHGRIGSVDPATQSDVSRSTGPAGPDTASPPSQELGALLADVSKMRHELNNHLTSALAEIQLLLMDVESQELRESYEIIEESLRGMRTVIAAVGRRPNQQLFHDFEWMVDEVHGCGDALVPQGLTRAIHGGYWLGVRL